MPFCKDMLGCEGFDSQFCDSDKRKTCSIASPERQPPQVRFSDWLSCPFCGSFSLLTAYPTSYEYYASKMYYVFCHECKARGPIKDSEDEAKKAFNRRHCKNADGDMMLCHEIKSSVGR